MADEKRPLTIEWAPDDFLPVCPHCDLEMEKLIQKKVSGGMRRGVGAVLCCPQCRKPVGNS